MDKTLRNEVVVEVRKVLQSVYETNHEVWVSGDQLASQFSCFSKGWLKIYGHTLPRTRAIVTDDKGKEHASSWTYPLHKIQRMMMNNEMKFLKSKQYENSK